MAIVTVAGETGCRYEDPARAAAHLLQWELIAEARLDALIAAEFGDAPIPDKVWAAAASSVLAQAATDHHLVIAIPNAQYLFPELPGVLRVYLVGRSAHRTGNLMLDLRLDRAAAAAALRQAEIQDRRRRKALFNKTTAAAVEFDLILNAERFQPGEMAELIRAGVDARRLAEDGLLSRAAESQIQFQARLQLARCGIVPAGKGGLQKKSFGHPSEELFANLLDFYRIAWEYEPRSFPLQWNKEGQVTEAFTPDFYLPEVDLYIELTTMKQSLVTRKNRKIKRLNAIYPHVNIQVFYQKDFQDLVSKYGLADRVAAL